MKRVVYTDGPRSFEKYDDTHYMVYLNEEVIPDYTPEARDDQPTPAPITAYAYSGEENNGGTLIETTSCDRDSLINGIIRTRYSQSAEDAIKTHQIELLKMESHPKSEEYEREWVEFSAVREMAKSAVDGWPLL